MSTCNNETVTHVHIYIYTLSENLLETGRNSLNPLEYTRNPQGLFPYESIMLCYLSIWVHYGNKLNRIIIRWWKDGQQTAACNRHAIRIKKSHAGTALAHEINILWSRGGNFNNEEAAVYSPNHVVAVVKNATVPHYKCKHCYKQTSPPIFSTTKERA